MQHNSQTLFCFCNTVFSYVFSSHCSIIIVTVIWMSLNDLCCVIWHGNNTDCVQQGFPVGFTVCLAKSRHITQWKIKTSTVKKVDYLLKKTMWKCWKNPKPVCHEWHPLGNSEGEGLCKEHKRGAPQCCSTEEQEIPVPWFRVMLCKFLGLLLYPWNRSESPMCYIAYSLG